MKYVQHPCADTSCICYSEWGGSCAHKILGSGEQGIQILQCDKCGAVSRREPPQVTRSVKKRSYPYYNASTGVTFESDSHEKAYVKQNNLEAV